MINPSQLRDFLDSNDLRPKKSLSQNFLIDKNIVVKILKTANVAPGDLVVEIGPGPGALTEMLLDAGAEVIAIEKDTQFASHLSRFKDLTVYEGDVMDFPFDTIPRKGKVVSNLPYHLTSPILGLVLPRNDLFTSLTLMVQEEVARRIVASPGSKDYSSLSLFVRFFSDPEFAFKVSPRSFYPIPKVTSAVVHLTLKKRELPFETAPFLKCIRRAFSKRRKMLRSTVPELNLGTYATKRPEELSIDEWIELYTHTLQSGHEKAN